MRILEEMTQSRVASLRGDRERSPKQMMVGDLGSDEGGIVNLQNSEGRSFQKHGTMWLKNLR